MSALGLGNFKKSIIYEEFLKANIGNFTHILIFLKSYPDIFKSKIVHYGQLLRGNQFLKGLNSNAELT